MKIPGYQIKDTLSANEMVSIMLAEKREDQSLQILKGPSHVPAPGKILARLKHEYEIVKGLSEEGLTDPPAWEMIEGTPYLIRPYKAGISLREYLKKYPYSLQNLLDLGIELCRVLSRIHHLGIIHKDINPTNIVVSEDLKSVNLIDFGLAGRIELKNQNLGNPGVLEGTLLYISPEQTGRMNRMVDHRTDLYSLGVVLFEVATGRLPFLAGDPMALIHAHIAKTPPDPRKLRAQLSDQVSKIILTLINKNPEDRYQSAAGLLRDLERCKALWQEKGHIEVFPLSASLQAGSFHIPERLYGREAEIAQLFSAFEACTAGGRVLMKVKGPSGVGKSATVAELHQRLGAHHAYFIEGKFDLLNRKEPYTAWHQAFSQLIQLLLTEEEAKLDAYRAAVITSLGRLGSVLKDWCPDFRWLVEAEEKLPDLPAEAARQRFYLTITRFIKLIARPEHPLVIFLDDVQWIDAASLDLLIRLSQDQSIHHVFFLLSFRENEVKATDPFGIWLEQLPDSGEVEELEVFTIALGNLKVEAVGQWLADTLFVSYEAVEELAQLVYEKTQGNPFFVMQFIQQLHRDEHIVVDPETHGWKWSIEQLRRLSITDNVVELLEARLKGLSENGRNVLQVASCIGNRFTLDLLRRTAGTDQQTLVQALQEAIQVQMILPLHADYDVLAFMLRQGAEENAAYKFVHDRIHHAAYAIISPQEKVRIHTHLGHLLEGMAASGDLEENIFEIVNHLNVQEAATMPPAEQVRMASLNLTAAQKAKAANAYALAHTYLQRVEKLLGPEGWEKHYDLTLPLYQELTEISYLMDDFEAMDAYFDSAKAHVRALPDLAGVYEVKIGSHGARYQFQEAIQTGREFLENLGLDLPREPSFEDVMEEFGKTEAALGAFSMDELYALPELEDPTTIAQIRTIQNVEGPAYISSPILAIIVGLRKAQLVVAHGNNEVSPNIFMSVGFFYMGMFQQIDRGYELAQLGIRLLDKYDPGNGIGIFSFNYAAFVAHWKFPYKEVPPLLMEAYQKSLETGKMDYVGYALTILEIYETLTNADLMEAYAQIDRHQRRILEIKQLNTHRDNTLFAQFVYNLIQPTASPAVLDGDICRRDDLLANYQQDANITYLASYYFFQALLATLFRDYSLARNSIQAAVPFMQGTVGTIQYALGTFLMHLLPFLDWEELSESEREEALKQVEGGLTSLRTWSDHVPANHLHRLHFLQAEKHRVLKQPGEARLAYDQALSYARSHNDLWGEGLVWERLAHFYQEEGLTNLGETALLNAKSIYQAWGAEAKVHQLDALFPQLKHGTRRETLETTQSIYSSSTRSGALDLSSVIKASTAISREILLPRLLEKLMLIVGENAGAQRGAILLVDGGQLMQEATYDLARDPGQPVALGQVPLSDSQRVPTTVIQLVQRTRQTLVLEMPQKDPRFAKDPYFEDHPVQSLLCTPILHQGKLQGVLYLEHLEVAGAFTQERVQVLKLLSGQIAVSVENARLYENLEEMVELRTRELSETLAELKTTQQQLVQSAKMASLGQLTAGMAHEINNPINYVLSGADSLEEDLKEIFELVRAYQGLSPENTDAEFERVKSLERQIDPESIQEEVFLLTAGIKGGAERTMRIIGDLRTFSRLDEDNYLKETDIHQNLDAVLGLVHKQSSKLLEIERKFGDLPLIQAYPGQLNQVFVNILNNALEAVPPSGKILIETRPSGNKVLISISDNGPGIPKDILPRIFDPFFTTKPVGKGTGLGLSTAYSIIEMHQGKLSVESEPGAGATFTIILPVKPELSPE